MIRLLLVENRRKLRHQMTGRKPPIIIEWLTLATTLSCGTFRINLLDGMVG